MVSRPLTYSESMKISKWAWGLLVGAIVVWGSRPPIGLEGSRAAAEDTRSQAPAGTADWPRFLGPRQDGTSLTQDIRKDWSNGNLPVLWHAEIGTSYGIGSVSKGRYYQFDRVGNQERLRCLETADGRELWSESQPVEYRDLYGYNNGPRSSPALAGDAVVTYGVAGRLTCRDAETGKLRWSVDTNQRYGVIQNFFGVGSSPLIDGDQVIVMVGGSPAADQTIAPGALDRVSPNGSAVVAFDRASGRQRWKSGDYLASYSVPRRATIAGKPMLLTLVREGLLALDPRNGKELWFFDWKARQLESVNAAVPVVVDDQVLISECYALGTALLEVDAAGAKVVWQDQKRSRERSFRAHWATPIYHEGALFGCSGRNPSDSDLRCIDWSTGKVHWVDRRRTRSSLLYVDDHFVVLDEDGRMQLIEANADRLQVVTEIDLSRAGPGRPALRGPCWAAPILAAGKLYVRGRGRVVCFQLSR